jgi:hypothetical protein
MEVDRAHSGFVRRVSEYGQHERLEQVSQDESEKLRSDKSPNDRSWLSSFRTDATVASWFFELTVVGKQHALRTP